MTLQSVLFRASVLLLLVAQSGYSEKKGPTPEEILVSYGVQLTDSSLVLALANSQPAVRENAARVLGARRIRAAVIPLRGVLKDQFVFARVAAAGALLELQDDSGLPVLKDALASRQTVAAIEAALALAKAGRDEGYEPMARRLSETTGDETDRLLVVRAMPAFLPLPGKAALVRSALINTLLNDAGVNVRRAAAEEASKLAGTEVAGAFAQVLTKEPDEVVRAIATAYLAKRKP